MWRRCVRDLAQTQSGGRTRSFDKHRESGSRRFKPVCGDDTARDDSAAFGRGPSATWCASLHLKRYHNTTRLPRTPLRNPQKTLLHGVVSRVRAGIRRPTGPAGAAGRASKIRAPLPSPSSETGLRPSSGRGRASALRVRNCFQIFPAAHIMAARAGRRPPARGGTHPAGGRSAKRERQVPHKDRLPPRAADIDKTGRRGIWLHWRVSLALSGI